MKVSIIPRDDELTHVVPSDRGVLAIGGGQGELIVNVVRGVGV